VWKDLGEEKCQVFWGGKQSKERGGGNVSTMTKGGGETAKKTPGN